MLLNIEAVDNIDHCKPVTKFQQQKAKHVCKNFVKEHETWT